MEMLLMGACLAMFGIAVACLAFGAATRDVRQAQTAAPSLEKDLAKAAAAPARFFVDLPAPPIAARPRVPIEVLLLQLEKHVRLEQAAAECFLESPDIPHLRSRTTSPLGNWSVN